MAKVTLNVNLFPCTREVPAGATDLSTDIQLAKALGKAATQLFWLRNGAVVFSGYTLEGDEELSIQLWHKGKLYREARFSGIGFSGVLFVDITVFVLREAMGCDILGELYRTRRCDTPVAQSDGESATEVSHLRVSIQGSIPKSLQRRGPRRKPNREAVVQRLMDYLESGC